jgi:hypothetical protein
VDMKSFIFWDMTPCSPLSFDVGWKSGRDMIGSGRGPIEVLSRQLPQRTG